jgi:hypothetical protein
MLILLNFESGLNVLNTDFRLSWWLVIDVNFVLGLLHHMVVGDDADVSEI